MVADYLHWAGTSESTEGERATGELYDKIEIVTLLERDGAGDPLWVIRARRR